MEICKTNRCSNNDNSGRYGYARECSKCDKFDDCKKWHRGIDLNAAENTESLSSYIVEKTLVKGGVTLGVSM